MQCYIIVRHVFGHDFHRNTLRSRDNSPQRGRGRGKPGRGFCQDATNVSFVLFAGACIETWNLDREDGVRRCTYYEIFNKETKPPAGQRYPYRYPKVSDGLFDKLLASTFPPPLLAVATCDVIPLNLLVKGERYSSSRGTFTAKVLELAGKPRHKAFREIREISDAHFTGDTLGKSIPISSFKVNESVPDESESDIYSVIDARNGWIEPDEKAQVESPAILNPRNIIKGARVQNIEFHGGWKISRRMACYWRNDCHREYLRCCDFIRSLLKKPWPRAPSTEGMASTAPLFNAWLKEDVRRTRKTGGPSRNANAGENYA